ncbi:hypothetical protein CLPUN_08430 [Clostridium puniceum]|uniref:Uncharacterized protein n=1 Tax=Clostridium puniceum TaxID=29367 RepID=A0A1S8TVQ4_9CLOT|nr:hypothetical protein CLPUN_08430 [Clostridium puniceum]
MKRIFNILLNCIIFLISVLIQKILDRLLGFPFHSLTMYWGSILFTFFIISLWIEFIKSYIHKDTNL